MNSRILPAVALLISVGLFFAYVNKMWAGPIAETKAEIASDQAALDVAEQFTRKQAELEAQKNAINPDELAKLNVLLPNSVDNVHMVLDLNALAAKSGLVLSSIDAAASPLANQTGGNTAVAAVGGGDASPVGSIDLTLTAVGTYDKLQTFLQAIEHSERMLDVHDIDVRGSDTGVYTYQIKIRLYWLH